MEKRQASGALCRLIDEALLDALVGVDPAIAQEGPVRAVFIDSGPHHVREDDFLAIDAAFGEDLSARRDEETLAPKFQASPADGCFVADAIDGCDVATVRDGVAALHGFPGGMLRLSVFFFLGRMPADGGRIKEQLRAVQRGQPRRFRKIGRAHV